MGCRAWSLELRVWSFRVWGVGCGFGVGGVGFRASEPILRHVDPSVKGASAVPTQRCCRRHIPKLLLFRSHESRTYHVEA